MRGIIVAIGIAVLAAGVAAPTLACTPPSPPYDKPRKPVPPTKPWCAGSRTCSQYQVDDYNRQVDRYNEDLRRFEQKVGDYRRRLEDYLRDAKSYAQCELDRAYD